MTRHSTVNILPSHILFTQSIHIVFGISVLLYPSTPIPKIFIDTFCFPTIYISIKGVGFKNDIFHYLVLSLSFRNRRTLFLCYFLCTAMLHKLNYIFLTVLYYKCFVNLPTTKTLKCVTKISLRIEM